MTFDLLNVTEANKVNGEFRPLLPSLPSVKNALAKFDFAVQSNCMESKLGRRKSANHPHFDGAFRCLSPRARADHAFRRRAGRWRRRYRAVVSLGFDASILRALAWRGGHRRGRRIFHRAAAGDEGQGTILVAADAPRGTGAFCRRWLSDCSVGCCWFGAGRRITVYC